METYVEINASFSHSSNSARVSFLISNDRNRITCVTASSDFKEAFPDSTSPRVSVAPLELSQSDLVRLLTYLEGELQARDVVIAALKSEKAKQLLHRTRYGHLSLNDPFAALQRDSDFGEECDGFDELEIGHWYDSQLKYLERLISLQRRTHLRAKQILSFVRNQHDRIIRGSEQNRECLTRSIIEVRNAKGESAEGAAEQCKHRHSQAELARTKQAVENERKRHKDIVLYLLGEYERLFTLTEAENKQKAVGKGKDSGDGIEKCQRNGIREKCSQLGGKRGAHKRITKDEGTSAKATQAGEVPQQNEPAENSVEKANHATSGGQTIIQSPSSCGDSLEIASLGVDFYYPQQVLHASGILRRSGSAVTSTNRTGVLSAAKYYISNATKIGIGRRQVYSASPVLRRCVLVNETPSEEQARNLPTIPDSKRGSEENSRIPLLRESNSSFVSRSLQNSTIRKEMIVSSVNGNDLEPEIAELESVLQSLTASQLDGTPGGSRRKFPNVEESPAEKRLGERCGFAYVENEQRRDSSGGSLSSDDESTNRRHLSNEVTALSKQNGQCADKPQRQQRIPVACRKQEGSPTGTTSGILLNRKPSTASAGQQERKPAAGCSSPYLALQRKAKAITGLATRIQRRVVSGVVGQLTVHRPDGEQAKENTDCATHPVNT